MDPTPEFLAELESHEQTIIFPEFTSKTALELGNALIAACPSGKGITVSIIKNGHLMFYHSMDGCNPDNDHWIQRKNRTVNRFHMSSYRFGRELAAKGQKLKDRYCSEEEYCEHGGAFPLKVKGSGVIGTITVSGLPQHDDHMLFVNTAKKYLNLA
ncbi:hypothetical protein HK097_009110 [Rhizophlyctis rosea]|uniref:Uncharacterized protein n=1 Tax=Rhizophlyctis rosea TaxID=64517 RepID=A0AAD5SBQ8_9FUNG|nr:hypothetical protein HK097_009110 [Rhizophlyctis rosea]